MPSHLPVEPRQDGDGPAGWFCTYCGEDCLEDELCQCCDIALQQSLEDADTEGVVRGTS